MHKMLFITVFAVHPNVYVGFVSIWRVSCKCLYLYEQFYGESFVIHSL